MIAVQDTIDQVLMSVGLRSRETLFDADFYLSNYPDVAAAGIDPYFHYINYGVAENRSPNVRFDTQYYLSQTKDRPRDPTRHYLRKGAAAGLDPHPLFETRWYLSAHPDVGGARLNPLKHYLNHGRHEGRETAPRFRRTFGQLAGFSRDPVVNSYKSLAFSSPGKVDGRKSVFRGTTEPTLHDSYVLMASLTEPQRQALIVGLDLLSSRISKAERQPNGGTRAVQHPETHHDLDVSLQIGADIAGAQPTLGLVFVSAFVANTPRTLDIEAAALRVYFIEPIEVRVVRAYGPVLFAGRR